MASALSALLLCITDPDIKILHEEEYDKSSCCQCPSVEYNSFIFLKKKHSFESSAVTNTCIEEVAFLSSPCNFNQTEHSPILIGVGNRWMNNGNLSSGHE